MTKIFLSYRRDDTSGHAGRLADRLCARFGRDAVFRDLDSIRPGRDFTLAINEAIGACDSVVAVIGRHWAGAGPDGQRRIDDPEDFVRVELAAALERQVHLIPVLVDRAQMPSAESLPLPLAPLARRQAFEISESRWDYDVQRLIDVLDPSSPQTLSGSMPVTVVSRGPDSGTHQGLAARVSAGPRPGKRRWVAGAVAGGLLLVVVAVLVMLAGGGDDDDPSLTAGGSTVPASTASTAVQASTTGLALDDSVPTGGGITPGQASPPPAGGVGGVTTPTPTTPTPTPPSATSPAQTTPAPTTPAPTSPAPTTPAPTVAPTAALTADAVAGNWSGTVSDGGGGSFLITVSVRAGCGIGQTCGTVYVSNNNCTGDFILYSLSGGTYEFTVANFTSTSGPNCSPGPGEYLTPQGGATLYYSTNYGPQGTLNRV